jgi:hypothetical protein
MQRAPAGLLKMPLGAPITTPPAKVAFKMSYIENFSLRRAVIMKVLRQLPVNEMMVLVTITDFS